MIHTLEADGIMLEFGTRKILSDIYFKCETGTITGILGRNGQGKTCLMNIVYGCLDAAGKSVRFNNVSVFQAYKRPDLLTYLPQFNFIPASLSVKRVFSDFGLNYQEFEEMFPEFYAKKGLSMDDLSEGQRRLIEVYMIIRSTSQFSILDEPFSHLMPPQIEKITALLAAEKLKKGFIITDHMYRHVLDVCDALYVLADGKMHFTKDINDIEKLGYIRL